MAWRDKAAPIIREVIKTVGKSDMKALRKALRDAYPFGPRQYHPYKIWCDEVNRQLGLKKDRQRTQPATTTAIPGQLGLFESEAKGE